MSTIKTISLGYVNAFLINSSVIVDTGTKKDGKRILNYLENNGIAKNDIKLIIVTHAHSDHIGSVKELKNETGAKVLIHDLEYNKVIDKVDPQIAAKDTMGERDRQRIIKDPAFNFDADIIISEEYDLKDFGVDAKVVPTPGHSPGSVSILFDNGDVIIGDSIMAFLPFAKPHKPIIYYDLPMNKQSMESLIKRGAKRFYLSHGKVYDVGVIEGVLDRF